MPEGETDVVEGFVKRRTNLAVKWVRMASRMGTDEGWRQRRVDHEQDDLECIRDARM